MSIYDTQVVGVETGKNMLGHIKHGNGHINHGNGHIKHGNGHTNHIIKGGKTILLRYKLQKGRQHLQSWFYVCV